MDCVGYLYLIELERGSGRANRKWCALMGRVEVQQVVEGEGVYKCVCGWELLLCVGWLSPLFEFMKQWLPWFAEIEAPISVHVIWMHLYFYGFYDETIQPGINTTQNHATDILHSPAYKDGTDSEFRNVGNLNSDAWELPKKEHITFRTWRKLENKKEIFVLSTVPIKNAVSFLSIICAEFQIMAFLSRNK